MKPQTVPSYNDNNKINTKILCKFEHIQVRKFLIFEWLKAPLKA